MDLHYRKIAACCILLIFSHEAFSGYPKLSNQAHISLLTCSPGKALYEAFGHSALRVYDPVTGIDRSYNYGTFDFDQPNFYINFIQGELVYMLSVSHSQNFVGHYVYYNRSVYEDVLNLDSTQKQHLFEFLEDSYKPENRYYFYDYIYDNCATKIRDVVEDALNQKVVFDSLHISTDYSIRELMDLYLKPQPWGDFGIDLALGTPIDKDASSYEYMYLPDYLKLAFENARIVTEDTVKPLVLESMVINEATPEQVSKIWFTPFNLFLIIGLLVLIKSFFDWRNQKRYTWLDVLLFGFVGSVGAVMGYISFFTDHEAASNNFNLLWAVPFHLLIAICLPFINTPSLFRLYFLATIILAVFLLIGSLTFITQKMHLAFYPIVAILLIRAIVLFRNNRIRLRGGNAAAN